MPASSNFQQAIREAQSSSLVGPNVVNKALPYVGGGMVLTAGGVFAGVAMVSSGNPLYLPLWFASLIAQFILFFVASNVARKGDTNTALPLLATYSLITGFFLSNLVSYAIVSLGAVVVGYEIGRQLKTETIFAERVNNNLLLRRGFEIKENANVLIVEDVITTGKSALECSKIVKIAKANLLGYACIIDRSNEDVLIKDKIISQIKFRIETFSKDKLPKELKNIKPSKPGSRSLSKL